MFIIFTESNFLANNHPRMAGSVMLKFDPSSETIDLYWLHTTRTMGVGYMTTNFEKPQVK